MTIPIICSGIHQVEQMFMYLNKIHIKNIRSIAGFEMDFRNRQAGWHVVIGDNGSGKSTIVRCISLGIIGPADAKALRLNLNDWVGRGSGELGEIALRVQRHDYDGYAGQSRPRTRPFDAVTYLEKMPSGQYALRGRGDAPSRYIWSNTSGWFSCAFGPFRRFTGGDKEWMKVYYSDPRAAAHLSVFGEDVALTEAIDWLKDLHIKSLENNHRGGGGGNDGAVLEMLKAFINEAGLLPHSVQLDAISSDGVYFVDGNGQRVDVTQMSDGYRSILSLTFELIRQLVRAYGRHRVFAGFSKGDFRINLPGVVIVDEIDAHLHPTWQTRIGEWFTQIFPEIQFIVTTHSPLICRAAGNGSIWRLKTPGTEHGSGEVTGIDKERLLYGDLLDAYGTELFGRDVTQSESGQDIARELATLNLKSFKQELTEEEKNRLEDLKTITSSIKDVTPHQ